MKTPVWAMAASSPGNVSTAKYFWIDAGVVHYLISRIGGRRRGEDRAKAVQLKTRLSNSHGSPGSPQSSQPRMPLAQIATRQITHPATGAGRRYLPEDHVLRAAPVPPDRTLLARNAGPAC